MAETTAKIKVTIGDINVNIGSGVGTADGFKVNPKDVLDFVTMLSRMAEENGESEATGNDSDDFASANEGCPYGLRDCYADCDSCPYEQDEHDGDDDDSENSSPANEGCPLGVRNCHADCDSSCPWATENAIRGVSDKAAAPDDNPEGDPAEEVNKVSVDKESAQSPEENNAVDLKKLVENLIKTSAQSANAAAKAADVAAELLEKI